MVLGFAWVGRAEVGETGSVMKRAPLRHVSIHGHEVGYRRDGDANGEAVLLIHGHNPFRRRRGKS